MDMDGRLHGPNRHDTPSGRSGPGRGELDVTTPPKTMLIIGNGPSTKELADYGFDRIPSHVDTFGMGLAYKEYSRLTWWPTYYACADQKVVKHQRDTFVSLVRDPKVTVKRFYFALEMVASDRLEVIPHSSTGDFCFQKSVELGYEQIFLIGIDLDYKPIKEASLLSREEFDALGLDMEFDTNRIYCIRRPIKDHPNYFFDDYQEVGDIFSEPRGSSWHLLSWYRARELAESNAIAVRNLGRSSALTLFHPLPLPEAFESLHRHEPSFPESPGSEIATKVFHGEKAVSDGLARELGVARRALAGFDASLEALGREIASQLKTARGGDPAISVIIPCYNAEAHLSPCLEALTRQTLTADQFEVICVDDCSTDGTVGLILTYQHRIPNLRLIRHDKNRQQGAARNTGLCHAKGKFVTFVDADDFLRLDALEVLLNTAGDATELVVAQHVLVRYDKPFKPRRSNRRIENGQRRAVLDGSFGWWPFGMLISRGLLDRNGIRFREGVSFEDIDFNVRVVFAASSCLVSREELYYYVQRDGSTVTSLTEKKLSDAVEGIAEVFQLVSHRKKAERAAFAEQASTWLLFQATRLRDSSYPHTKKRELAGHLVETLRTKRLHRWLDRGVLDRISRRALEQPPASDLSPTDRDEKMKPFECLPWGATFQESFRGKVIFFCEVDYHIRSAAPVARELRARGIESVIVDASRSTSFTSNRPLPVEEERLYADLDILRVNVAETLPFATDAAAFVFMNDLTYTKRLIFENFGFGVPTFGFYEGINDDWNVDRKALRRPYRSTDHLLLPGMYQKGFYQDRDCRVVGLPNVRRRLAAPYVPPSEQLAVINVNFTYNVLEDRRDRFVETAVRACEQLGLKYLISQHPADKADLSRFHVASESVYDLLARGSILISRFSTTILEALAMGRAVVYHNPIEERVPKFQQPLGAFGKSNCIESLKRAMTEQLGRVSRDAGTRHQAALFLHFHCNTSATAEPEALAADAIAEVVANEHLRFAFKASRHPGSCQHPETTTRSQHSQPNVSPTPDPFHLFERANNFMRAKRFLEAMETYRDLHDRLSAGTDEADPLLQHCEFNARIAARRLRHSDVLTADHPTQTRTRRASTKT